MNELIKITKDETGKPAVSGRELHAFLEVTTPYHIWFPRMVEYGFLEKQDFEVLNKIVHNSQGGRPSTDHAISLDMAKEIAMIQRTEKGKQARQYFIECERQLNKPVSRIEQVINGLFAANQIIEEQKRQLTAAQILLEDQAPKVRFADTVADTESCMTVGTLAKVLNDNGFATGEKRFFETLCADGFLCSQGQRHNVPTQRAMDLGLFRLKETAITHSDGHVTTSITPKITGKGQLYFFKKYTGKTGEIVDGEVQEAMKMD